MAASLLVKLPGRPKRIHRQTTGRRSAAFLAYCILLIGASPGQAAGRALSIETDGIGSVAVLAPDIEPQNFIVLISDNDGVTPKLMSGAESLVGRGAAVAIVDINAYRVHQSKATGDDCAYAFGVFEDLARLAQRQLKLNAWRWPAFLGLGDGGALAYLAVAQAPVNTAAGAVSIGFSPEFKFPLHLCPGAPTSSKSDKGDIYTPMANMPAPWKLIVASAPTKSVRAFIDAGAQASVDVVPGDDDARFSAAMAAVLAMRPPVDEALGDLPLTELRGESHADTMVIFISGDGGWRDLDKQIGEYLSRRGVPVVGVDALRYFWRRKEPSQIAADLERIVKHYSLKWNLRSVALAGYSFGADALPLAWPKLSRDTQQRTRLIALLGLEPTADLQISVSGWLGVQSATDIDVRPYLTDLPKAKVLCFFGSEERESGDTACAFPEMEGAERVERPGGHHFDGNYDVIAAKILERLAQSSQQKDTP